MIFIKLTQWNGIRYEMPLALNNGAHGWPIYVNALLITDMFRFRSYVYHTHTDSQKPYSERDSEEYTELNLCARGQEDQVTRMVQETPEQILELIEKANWK